MRNPTLIIEKTLGKLREIYITNDLVKGREDAISRFSAEKETLRIWQDYGQYNEDRLTIIHDGKTDNIVMDGFVISPVVKDTHFFTLSSGINSHKFEIIGETPEGQAFELRLGISEPEILPYIVYAIILLSYIKDVEKTEVFLKMIRTGYLSGTIGEKIDLIIEFKGLCGKVINEYPFMKLFLQKGFNEVIESIKSEIGKLSFLHNN